VAQLLQRPLPDGVDPTRLELYVDPQHFQVNTSSHGTHSYDTSNMFVVKLVLGRVSLLELVLLDQYTAVD
jgi:hypothetical protein